jgi:hypothetical protein
MIVLLLLGAAVDLKLPGRTRDRVRIHLIDRSASVLVPGPAESLVPHDADDIVARDVQTKSGGDAITWASFGRTPAFESRSVDASATGLAEALTAALGRNPTEIVLYTDGRGDPGTALFLCRDRNVPVHLLPLGPTSVKDVRIVRIESPADAPPGTALPVGVVVESTFDVRAGVKVGAETREVDLTAKVPARLAFTLPEPGEFTVELAVQDACPENNRAVGEVLRRTDKRRVLLLSDAPLPLPDFELQVARQVRDLAPFDAVVVDSVDLAAEDQRRLADWLKSGGGVLLLGGPRSYAMGSWKGGPIEEISPLKMKPDLRVAAVLGIDASGSMSNVFDDVSQVLVEARDRFDADDDVVGMTFADHAKILDLRALRKERPTGGTRIGRGIEMARQHLQTRQAGRRVIILMTDGQSAAEETPDKIQRELQLLQDIALIVVTTDKEVPGARNIHISSWNGLHDALKSVFENIQDLRRENPGPVDVQSHPSTAGVGPFSPAWVHRTTPRTGAQVVATVGRPPAQDPVLAFGRAGAGRVGALTIEQRSAPPRLLRQAVEAVAGDGDAGLTLSIDPPFVRARGTSGESTFETAITKVLMKQVGSDAWEGRLPEGLSGKVVVAKGRARAVATIPCPPEFERLGVDRAALERIARETGGQVLRSPQELATLPRAENPAPTRARVPFLIAALVLVFVELAVSTFWKV